MRHLEQNLPINPICDMQLLLDYRKNRTQSLVLLSRERFQAHPWMKYFLFLFYYILELVVQIEIEIMYGPSARDGCQPE